LFIDEYTEYLSFPVEYYHTVQSTPWMFSKGAWFMAALIERVLFIYNSS